MDCTLSVQARQGRPPASGAKGKGFSRWVLGSHGRDVSRGGVRRWSKTPLRPRGGPTGGPRPEVRAMDQGRKDEAGAGPEGQAMAMGVGVGPMGKSRGGWGSERGVVVPGGSGLVAGCLRGLSLRWGI